MWLGGWGSGIGWGTGGKFTAGGAVTPPAAAATVDVAGSSAVVHKSVRSRRLGWVRGFSPPPTAHVSPAPHGNPPPTTHTTNKRDENVCGGRVQGDVIARALPANRTSASYGSNQLEKACPCSHACSSSTPPPDWPRCHLLQRHRPIAAYETPFDWS